MKKFVTLYIYRIELPPSIFCEFVKLVCISRDGDWELGEEIGEIRLHLYTRPVITLCVFVQSERCQTKGC